MVRALKLFDFGRILDFSERLTNSGDIVEYSIREDSFSQVNGVSLTGTSFFVPYN